MSDTDKRLDAACKKYREAQHEVTHLSVHALCEAARVEFPDCKTLTFEWSDQGSWLCPRAVDDHDDWEDLATSVTWRATSTTPPSTSGCTST